MIYRIKQFCRGLLAKVTPEDQKFLEMYLNDHEIALFYRLRMGEQRHCLNIAYDCLSSEMSDPFLIKAALLHDVGKIHSNLTLVNKALVVLVLKLHIPEKILPKFLKKALYYKMHHPTLGAKILEESGTEPPVIFLTRYHHHDLMKNPVSSEECLIENGSMIENLKILQKNDEKN